MKKEKKLSSHCCLPFFISSHFLTCLYRKSVVKFLFVFGFSSSCCFFLLSLLNIFVCCGKCYLAMWLVCCMHCKMLSIGIYLLVFFLSLYLLRIRSSWQVIALLVHTRVRSLFSFSFMNSSLYAMTLVSLLNVACNRMCMCAALGAFNKNWKSPSTRKWH